MIQYFLAGKDIKLLGSHSGPLQFGADNVIKFPSYLIKQFQFTANKFINYELTFQDPLLGNFTSFFVNL